MKNNSTFKEKIYWIGEHSFEIYKNTNQSILNNFENEVLLFSRINADTNDSSPIIYLDEFFPIQDRNYSVSDLQKPISYFLKDRKIPFEKGLIIGDASEIIVQALVAVGVLELDELFSEEEMVSEFEAVNKIETKQEFTMVDVSGFSILFLEEVIPFKDAVESAKKVKSKSTKTFHHVLNQKNNDFNMNEFLFHLESGIEEAVNKSNGLELN